MSQKTFKGWVRPDDTLHGAHRPPLLGASRWAKSGRWREGWGDRWVRAFSVHFQHRQPTPSEVMRTPISADFSLGKEGRGDRGELAAASLGQNTEDLGPGWGVS